MIKYYSEMLDKVFDSLKEAETAESQANEAADKQAEEKASATNAIEDAYPKLNDVTRKAYADLADCHAECKAAVQNYNEKYGAVNVKINAEGKVEVTEGNEESTQSVVKSLLDLFF